MLQNPGNKWYHGIETGILNSALGSITVKGFPILKQRTAVRSAPLTPYIPQADICVITTENFDVFHNIVNRKRIRKYVSFQVTD